MDRNFVNVIILGLSFMLLFTSFQTGGMIQGTVVKSIKDTHPEYKADAFISMCIVYLLLSISNWFAPAFVSYMGPRLSMILSGLTYIIFIANFLYPITWVLYVVSAIVGLGAGIIWTAQGNYLTLCSNKETISRNSGIFWALLQCSLLWGNLFVFFYFTKDTIDDKTRVVTYTVLTVAGSLGIVVFFFLTKPSSQSDNNEDIIGSDGVIVFVARSLKDSFKLLFTKQMFLLCITFWYTGLELGFFSVVYTTALGNTANLDSKDKIKTYIGLAGILIGLGEIVGGLLFGILGSKTNRMGRDPIVILGYLTHMVAFFLIFINFPKNSPFDSTTDSAYISPSLTIALACSFFLGFADSCYNSQIYSILGTLYADNSSPAFALFKFFQSVACACALFYSSVANLYIQLSILAVFASLGTATFVLVELKAKKNSLIDGRIHQN